MNDSPNARQVLLAYLLGKLAPEERSALEERMLAESDFSDQMQEAEYDLIDDYHAGRLEPAERRRAEAALTPERLSRSAPPFSGRRDGEVPRRSESRAWLRWSAAAVALAVLGFAGWSLVALHRARNLPHVVARTRPEGSSGGGNGPTAPGSGNGNSTAVLLLASDVTRGPGGLSLDLHPSTSTVIVQWVVPPQTGARSFQLSVTKEGKVLGVEAQDGGVKTISGHQVAEFRVDPAVFAVSGAAAHCLLLIRSGEAGSPVVAEFSVVVSHR
ncbi:MAG TPA: hypothetical protein VHX37_17825 [Acidobacteriaceae bacterium]|jgi:hypothetical protein|nr:hypothetical protein [Acidobacteriaceae bacterium]